MTDPAFEQRLTRWLVDREPGPAPDNLRDRVGQVAADVPIPTPRRVWRAMVRPADFAGTPGTTRLALVLALIGLLVAASVGAIVIRAPRAAAPELTSWRDFVVGRPAPGLEFRSVSGAMSDRDDATLDFEDMAGSLVVLFVPDPGSPSVSPDIGRLIEATLATSEPRTFIVATPADAPGPLSARAGVVTAELPAQWEATPEARGPAVLVVDRAGIVAAAFAERLPAPQQLADVLARAEATR